MSSAGRPAECVEDGDRVEVVPPVDDIAVAEGEDGDVAVGVAGAGGHDLARGGVLQDDRALGWVVVNGQVVAAVQDERVAVGPVQLGDRGAALDPSPHAAGSSASWLPWRLAPQATGSILDRGADPVPVPPPGITAAAVLRRLGLPLPT